MYQAQRFELIEFLYDYSPPVEQLRGRADKLTYPRHEHGHTARSCDLADAVKPVCRMASTMQAKVMKDLDAVLTPRLQELIESTRYPVPTDPKLVDRLHDELEALSEALDS
jgi:hypothetical protein